jgi:hypothetical protein
MGFSGMLCSTDWKLDTDVLGQLYAAYKFFLLPVNCNGKYLFCFVGNPKEHILFVFVLFTGQQYVDIHLAQPNYCC